MIKFFRKIRQNLLMENKTGKYFKYAIGEIILVVIGILIALTINDWNDQNKNTKSELIYYCRILEDFELDKQRIVELKNESNYRIDRSKKLLLDLDSGVKDKNFIINQFIFTTMYNRNYGGFDYVRIHSELRASVLNRKLTHINP
jgi:hypothetical protein